MGGVFNTVNLHTYNYSLNNPIKYTDPDGELPFLVVTGAVGAVAGAIVGGAVGAYKSYTVTGEVNWGDVGKGALIGGAAGGLIGVGVGAAGAKLIAGSALATTGEVMAGLGVVGGVAATSGGLTIAKGVETTLKDGQIGQVLLKGNEVVAFSTKAISHVDLAIKAGLDPNSVVGATVLKMGDVIKAVPAQSVQGAAQKVLDILPNIIQ
jgi:hypothetical protein